MEVVPRISYSKSVDSNGAYVCSSESLKYQASDKAVISGIIVNGIIPTLSRHALFEAAGFISHLTTVLLRTYLVFSNSLHLRASNSIKDDTLV